MLVIDANILIRAVLGRRVRELLTTYCEEVEFFSPDTAFQEAKRHLPGVLRKRGVPVAPAMQILNNLDKMVQIVLSTSYSERESDARRRLAKRDEADWPVLATALLLGCPVWTEDTDFFGTGVATWTTDRVELFLNEAQRMRGGI